MPDTPTLPCGRFAPSPTGPLHFGSLVAALASCLEARAHSGRWLVRMEDLDPPREQPGAAGLILSTLEAFGFEWDGAVMRQSERGAAYALALARLRDRGATFECACTRREIADSGLAARGEPVYPGLCRRGTPDGRVARSTRLRIDDKVIVFEDAIQGHQRQDLARDVGDFVIKRADGPFAYQLAVVVDDAAQEVTEVVRGADLLGSTGRQIYLQELLGLPTPRYAHVPAAVNSQGEKLSKQTRAVPLDSGRAAPTMVAALAFLGQQPPPGLARAPRAEVWRWALAHWRIERVPRARACRAPEHG